MDHFHSRKFSDRVKELMDQFHAPGIAVAIVHNGMTAAVGFGKASLDPAKDCTPYTLFDIAASSMSLTAASVGLLVGDNVKYPLVQYTTPVSTLLPGDFEMPGKGYTEDVTVEDILTHRTGMSTHDFSYMGVKADEPDDARSITRNLRNLHVVAPIRSKYIYCNMMFTVASYLVEKVTEVSFAKFLEENFFEPLAMNTTTLQPERARAKGLGHRIATGYSWDRENQKYIEVPVVDCPEGQGAGSIMTSANDYIKWVKAFMNHQHPITKNIYDGLIQPRIIQDPDLNNAAPKSSPTMIAAGWEVFYYRGHMLVIHDGSISGFSSTHFFLPEFKFGAVILSNSDTGHAVDILARELMDEVLGVPQTLGHWASHYTAYHDDRNFTENQEKHRQQLICDALKCPGFNEPQPQKMPLAAYVGEYWNPGYHGMTVQIKDGKLFIDATDRSMDFTLTFEHVCDQTKFIVCLMDPYGGGPDYFYAEFRFENDKAVKMGLALEDEKEFIWFDRALPTP